MDLLKDMVLPEHYEQAMRLADATDSFFRMGNLDLMDACFDELKKLYACKRDHDQKEILIRKLKRLGITHVLIPIEEVKKL